jgi:hypothetical protein
LAWRNKANRFAMQPIWIEAAHLAVPVGHPYYGLLNRLLSKRGFDAFAEAAGGPAGASGC